MSANTIVRGNSLGNRVLVKYLSGQYDLDGTLTADAIFAVSAAALLASFPVVSTPTGAQGEPHPLFSGFFARSFRWNHHPRVSAQVVFLTITYEAAPQFAGAEEDEADSIAGEEPIESHPNFLGNPGIAGFFPNNRTVTPASVGAFVPGGPGPGYFEGSPFQGVVFDTFGQNLVATAADYNTNVGKFLFFGPGFMINGILAVGLERYYLPRGTYSRSFSTPIRPSLAGVAGINGNPPNAPLLADGFTWLLSRRSYRTTGFLFRVTEQYLAGRWNPAIYGGTIAGIGGPAKGGASGTSNAGGIASVSGTPQISDGTSISPPAEITPPGDIFTFGL